MAAQLPATRLVYLADREADIMALMVRARDLGEPVDWFRPCRATCNVRIPGAISSRALHPKISGPSFSARIASETVSP